MGFAELAKKTMTKHCVKVPGDESVYLSTPKHIWSFFKLSLREHALFCTTVRHASNVWRYFFGDSNSGVISDLQNATPVDTFGARANTAHHWKFCRWRQLASMPIYNSVYKEKVLLGSFIQTSPNVALMSGDHALIVPAGAATPPHCDNPLHSSSCLSCVHVHSMFRV